MKASAPVPAKSQVLHTFRQLRQARGWTQQDVAFQLGATQGSVSQWERGYGRPRPATQQRLADLFGVGVGQIAVGQMEGQG